MARLEAAGRILLLTTSNISPSNQGILDWLSLILAHVSFFLILLPADRRNRESFSFLIIYQMTAGATVTFGKQCLRQKFPIELGERRLS